MKIIKAIYHHLITYFSFFHYSPGQLFRKIQLTQNENQYLLLTIV